VSDLYRLAWRPSARKELNRLDRQVAARILRAVGELTNDPRPPGVTRLTGIDGLWRIRVGDYRIVYEIQDGELIVHIVRVAHRSAVYRDL
jgi:mRNA interferase RelE/StbE